MTPDLPSRQFRLHLVMLALAWATFIVYGSLLPLDFRAATAESLARQFLGLGAPDSQLRSYTDWLTNIAIFVPLGYLGLGATARGRGTISAAAGMLFTMGGCIAVSVGIEYLQIFFPPRNSSILDIVANALGALAGMVGWLVFGKKTSVLYQTISALHQSGARTPSPSRKLQVSLLSGSFLIILAWGGVLTTGWSGWSSAIAKAHSLHILPFLEHQAADILLAVASTLLAAVAYSSVGMALWFSNIFSTASQRMRLRTTILLAMTLALLVEGIKLFLVAKRPDTGNIIIAGLAAVLGFLFAPWLARTSLSKSIDTLGDVSVDWYSPNKTKVSARQLVERALALLCAVAIALLVTTYPLGRVALALALAAYGVLLVRYPTFWLICVPAMLPVLDLAPWTGRFFFDEFDGILLVTLMIGLWRDAGKPLTATPGRGFWLWVACFLASFVVSAVVGMLPLQPMDANALASPYSHYSALRLAKGLLFATGLAILLSHHVAAVKEVKRIFTLGMLLGLAGATASVLWERIAYVGLTDFSKSFRVVGLFSTTNTGGPHLDAFLITVLPFALVLCLRARPKVTRIAAGILFAFGSYAVMITFSRAAVAGLAIVVLIITAWAIFTRKEKSNRSNGTGFNLVASLVLASTVIAPVLLGSFMQARLSTTGVDMGIRTSHWSEAVSIMTNNLTTSLFGMGLGRYPETYQLQSRQTNKPAIHRFETEADNTYLRIVHGTTLYVEQIVSPVPRSNYQIALRARTQTGNAAFNVLLCDRTFLQGFGCQSVTFNLTGNPGKWQPFEATLNSANVGETGLRIAKLSLENAGSSSPIDIDNIEMISPDGSNLLVNGNFQSGADRWYFSSPNNYSPWRIENLFLHIYFEQSWFGLLTFCLVIAAVVGRLARHAWQGSGFATSMLAAFIGFLAVGGFDSMFDAPRLILLFGLLIAASGIVYAQPAKHFQANRPSKPPTDNQADRLLETSHRHVALDSSVPLGLGWRRLSIAVAGKWLLLAIAIAIVTHLPFAPYNVRELPNPYHPVIAPLLLAALVFWIFGLPAVIARWLAGAGYRGIWLSLIVAGHGLIGWAMLHFAVLPESIHDVIGSPVLHWPGQTEYIARFVPLVSVLALQLVGGALFAQAMAVPLAASLVWWVLSIIMLVPLQYWVIVSQAATDNLTELMANGASIGAFLLLTGYLLLIGYVGSLLAALRFKASSRRFLIALAALTLSLPVGYLLVSAGTASVIVKEQRAFSALQFLLSSDRAHYAAGLTLWLRFAIAHLGAVFLIAFSQHSFWLEIWQRPNKHPRSAH